MNNTNEIKSTKSIQGLSLWSAYQFLIDNGYANKIVYICGLSISIFICLMRNILSIIVLFVVTTSYCFAGCDVDLSDYVGWEIIYSGTVTGYIDENGKEEDDFEGCDFGRVLIIDYTKQVTCSGYSYSYSYRPDIVVLSDGISMKACVNGNMYDVRQ